MYKHIRASIFDAPKGSIIIHQVNCQNAMGSGVAKAIYSRYPQVKSEYHKFCAQHTPVNLLGKWQVVDVGDYIIINLFGQLTYGRSGLHTNYQALEKAMNEIMSSTTNTTIVVPYKIGCGLGGGDWNIVNRILEQSSYLNPSGTLYVCEPMR